MGVIDVRARLTADDLPERVRLLGFREADVDDVLAAAAAVAGSPEEVARIEVWAADLVDHIGSFDPHGAEDRWPGAAEDERRGMGVLPMLALLVSADEVHAFHRSRGVPDDISWRSLSDLGQQVWVHRRTYGAFGLHTQDWLCIGWSGALYWLGRLQFDLEQQGGRWVLSTHIPQSGPLTPAAVDDAFRRAIAFFAEHFPEHPTSEFYCSSWLLDPELAAVLPAGSNMVRFQQRWDRYGEAMPADADALFFVFARRGDVDLDQLPRETTLQRGIIDRLRSGRHWSMCEGRIPHERIQQSPVPPTGFAAAGAPSA